MDAYASGMVRNEGAHRQGLQGGQGGDEVEDVGLQVRLGEEALAVLRVQAVVCTPDTMDVRRTISVQAMRGVAVTQIDSPLLLKTRRAPPRSVIMWALEKDVACT